MKFRRGALIYLIIGLVILVIHYLIPYTVLKEAPDMSLYMFWALLATLRVVATSLFIELRWGR